jgi:hypothetical protein
MVGQLLVICNPTSIDLKLEYAGIGGIALVIFGDHFPVIGNARCYSDTVEEHIGNIAF